MVPKVHTSFSFIISSSPPPGTKSPISQSAYYCLFYGQYVPDPMGWDFCWFDWFFFCLWQARDLAHLLYTKAGALFLSLLSPAEQVRDFLIVSAGKANDSEIRSKRGARLSVLAPNDWHGAGLHSLHLISTMNDTVCGPVLTVKRGKDKSVKVPTSVARRKCPCAQ